MLLLLCCVIWHNSHSYKKVSMYSQWWSNDGLLQANDGKMLVKDGEMLINEGEMLVNDGEMNWHH